MKRLFSTLILATLVTVSLLSFTRTASAEEIKMVGVITRLEISGKDAKEATATLKDNKSGNEIVITVTDELTLDKFKEHRIVEGDEIRCKYEEENGKKVSKYFRKTAGC